MDVTLTDRVAVHPSVISRELSGETVLLNLESGVYYGLDGVATRVWQLLQQDRTIAEVCDAVLAEYDVELDVVREDVSRLVGELRERGIVVPRRDAVQA
jgi:hypothetical protein